MEEWIREEGREMREEGGGRRKEGEQSKEEARATRQEEKESVYQDVNIKGFCQQKIRKISNFNLFLLMIFPLFIQLLPEYQAPVSVASNASDWWEGVKDILETKKV